MQNKKITVISGFGQEPKVLQNVFTNKDTIALNYLETKNFEDLITRDLKVYDNDIVIGWSLGGQVAIRLIEKQILKPKLLILIATPFQFVQNDKEIGLPINIFKQFESAMLIYPNQALNYLASLSATNDENAREVEINMVNYITPNLNSWLQELKTFDCANVNFSKFPETICIWGDGDVVVDNSQANYFKEKIHNLEIKIIKNAGHAPHFSHKNV